MQQITPHEAKQNLANNESITKMDNWIIRPIRASDNPRMTTIIQSVMSDMGLTGENCAYSDPEVLCMFETYQNIDFAPQAYWVVENKDEEQVYGGGGFARLKGTTKEDAIAELQKFYFLPELRGQGYGKQILERCIQSAKADDYKTLYAETMPHWTSAVKLYESYGFKHINSALGQTGHSKCQTFMALNLTS